MEEGIKLSFNVIPILLIILMFQDLEITTSVERF